MSPTPNAIIPGSLVTHPAHREPGVVTDVSHDRFTNKPTICWVEFPHQTWRQKFQVNARDLTLVEPVGERPALRVVDGAAS